MSIRNDQESKEEQKQALGLLMHWRPVEEDLGVGETWGVDRVWELSDASQEGGCWDRSE